jgi:uncharacterized membrane protein YccC
MQLRPHDPGLAALGRAARTAVVLPPLFAFALVVLDSDDVALFASFGSFAFLAFADFGGPTAQRVAAYLALTGAGAVLIAIATPLSGNPWLAAPAMALVGFAIAFSGFFGGYVAAAGTAATLAFVLAVTVPADAADIAPRLAGWCLAGAVAALAAVLLWPRHERDHLLGQAAVATDALAALVEEVSRDAVDAAAVHERRRAATSAVATLEGIAREVPGRPLGPTQRTQSLAYLVEEVRTLRDFADDFAAERLDGEPLTPGDRLLLGGVVSVLRNPGPNGSHLVRLERERTAHLAAVDDSVAGLADGGESPAHAERRLERTFRIRVLSYAALSAAANAELASGRDVPDERWELAPLVPPVELSKSTRRLAALVRGQVGSGSVWFRAGIRAGLALGLAVLVAGLAGVGHAFWVALATMSVLKSNSVGTRHTAWQALLGTVAGFGLATMLLLAIGDERTGLWIALPFCVFLAVYTPSALHFAVGQAMFTVTVVVLFNLISPEGWRTGLVRVEDIAIGVTTSILVGALLWPRGAGGQLRDAVAALLTAAAGYVRQATGAATGLAALADARAAGLASRVSSLRASDAFATYLDEQRPAAGRLRAWTTLVTAGEELGFVGDALVTLTAGRGSATAYPAAAAQLDAAAADLERRVARVAGSLSEPRPSAVADRGSGVRESELRAAVTDSLGLVARDAERADVEGAVMLAWTSDWIAFADRAIDRLEGPLAEARASAMRRWWR